MTGVSNAVPFLDTNMHRVLHRLFLGPDVPKPAAKAGEILALAANLVPSGEGWAWNQAVMEFGALRCTARRPVCEGCPLQATCAAHPGILDALAGMPHAARGEKSAGYETSNRYLRGRVLALLREDPAGEGVNLADLARSLLEDPTTSGMLRMREVVGTLERDGLARALPAETPPRDARPAGAVAEERARYDAGDESAAGDEDLAAMRITLP